MWRQGPTDNTTSFSRSSRRRGERASGTRAERCSRRTLNAAGASLIALLMGGMLVAPAPSRAAEVKAAIAFTPTAAVGAAFNAHYEGFFAKGGLETPLLMQSNSVGVVAAVQAGQAEIGSAATGVFFGAIAHGLPYVALGCQTTFGPGSEVLGVVVRKGEKIATPEEFVGKRVAVPGIDGGTHITFMEWLREHGVNPKKVTYVEANYPQQADILRGHTVDAIVTSQPYLSRILKAGLGTLVSHLNHIKASIPDSFYFVKRSWAKAHPKAVATFQAGLAEGVQFAHTHPEQSYENTAKALHQDVAFVSATGPQNYCGPDTAKYINEMNKVMIGLGLTKEPLDAAKVVWHGASN